MAKADARIPTRKTPLDEKLDKRLNTYGAAAAAAGVGLLALAPPAPAEVVYTPTHILYMATASRSLDMAHDGTNEFKVVDAGSGASYTFVYAVGRHGGDGVLVGPNCCQFAMPLTFGAKIGPSGLFYDVGVMARAYQGSSTGGWGKNRYLGLKFNLNGQEHYGWAEVSIAEDRKGIVTVLIDGYAYETIANRPILAGQTKEQNDAAAQIAPVAQRNPDRIPAMLGLLAVGSPGLSIWRRDPNR